MAMMRDGRVLGEGTPAAMRAHPDERVRDFLAGNDREGAVEDP
jgi:ABC-type transporter Mla maintaining outer membrane lipid asymmetry ATPase subunit MlaF